MWAVMPTTTAAVITCFNYRRDGLAKVTGQKVFAIDLRARDMQGRPAQQSHVLTIHISRADRIYEGLDLSVLGSDYQPDVLIDAESIAADGLRMPDPGFYGDFFVKKGQISPMLGHPVAEAEVRAMAAYLTQNREMPGPEVKAEQVPEGQINVKGENLYLGLCAGCHGAQGVGQPHSPVPMSTNTTAMFPTPINLIRVVREGVHERDLAQGERMQTMPGFADKLSNQEMADLVNYMRQIWGGRLGDVTATQVAEHVKTIEHSQ